MLLENLSLLILEALTPVTPVTPRESPLVVTTYKGGGPVAK